MWICPNCSSVNGDEASCCEVCDYSRTHARSDEPAAEVPVVPYHATKSSVVAPKALVFCLIINIVILLHSIFLDWGEGACCWLLFGSMAALSIWLIIIWLAGSDDNFFFFEETRIHFSIPILFGACVLAYWMLGTVTVFAWICLVVSVLRAIGTVVAIVLNINGDAMYDEEGFYLIPLTWFLLICCYAIWYAITLI